MANDRVVSKKTFGNHGLVIPGREPALKTNGGLMYYSYDGMRNVTELTDRHGDSIEKYRYDAFGGLYTGITAPYNTNGFAGKSYDVKANLIDNNARWYQAQNGRFTTADPYTGDILTPYTQNRYAYVGNNPINRWDPLGYWEDGDENLTPKAQAAIRRLTDQYDNTPIEDKEKRDSIHAQAESIRARDWIRWETNKETYKGSKEIVIEDSIGETYKVTGGWNTDWTKIIEYIKEYEVMASYYSAYAGKYAEERYTRYDPTTKHYEGFNFRPFTAQEWYEENKGVIGEYETPPPYIPMEAYSSITSEYSYSSSKITSGTAKLFNGDEVVWDYTFNSSLENSLVDVGRYGQLISSIDWSMEIIKEAVHSAIFSDNGLNVVDTGTLLASNADFPLEMGNGGENEISDWEKSIIGKIIVIDPGHGGSENGATRVYDNKTYYEKNLNLSIALNLKNYLESRGAKVIMTRTTDVDVSLDDRYELANESNADIFVSTHCNSSQFWWSGATVVYAENHDVKESRDLAEAINGSVYEWTSLYTNDVYKDKRGLAVLRGTNMPAVITETGYMSSNDIKYMINNTKEIAYGIAQGINQYFADKYHEK